MRTILALMVIVIVALQVSPSQGCATAAKAANSPSPAMFSASGAWSALPHWDSKRQEFPKKVPADVKKMTVPELNLLVDQVVRHSDLNSKATRIMPWVYSKCEEFLIADYEQAVGNLDSAEEHLQLAMFHLAEKNDQSIGTDRSVDRARQEIDQAEYIILFLLELASLEL